MKLKIKETGEILEDVKFIDTTLHKITIQYLDDGVLRNYPIKNLSDIEEVKDYEEPKGFWMINILGIVEYTHGLPENEVEMMKEIGNYFETKEEAEKAVEKLKAWKRLEDKGFRFIEGHLDNNDNFIIKAKLGNVGLIDQPDVSLLFGGEE